METAIFSGDEQDWKSSSSVIVHQNEKVRWTFDRVIPGICPMDLYYFPFDKQTCPLIWSIIHTPATQVKLVLLSYDDGEKIIHLGNDEWQFLEVTRIVGETLFK